MPAALALHVTSGGTGVGSHTEAEEKTDSTSKREASALGTGLLCAQNRIPAQHSSR